jgi:hypothetical protein
MISGKGILYTVLVASGAALLVGTMITGGKRREPLRRAGEKIQDFIGSVKRALPEGRHASPASDIDQVSPVG